MGKPSSQHVVWHRGGFFLASFMHLFLHFPGFVKHFLVRILHSLSGIWPVQLGADEGGGGLGEGGGGLGESGSK